MITAKATGAKKIWKEHIGKDGYMGISLHSENHSGDQLRAMVRWANEEGKFYRMRIGLSDTLNAYNYMAEEGLSYEDACNKARKIGDIWLSDNEHILGELNMPFDIVRWDHWKQECADEVDQYKAFFYDILKTDAVFRESMTQDLSSYFERRFSKALKDIDPAIVTHSLAYLVEELAVYSVIFRDRPATAIYPGKQLHCFEAIRGERVQSAPPYIAGSGFIRLALHGKETSAVNAPANLNTAHSPGLERHIA